jgi:hypothetical protein
VVAYFDPVMLTAERRLSAARGDGSQAQVERRRNRAVGEQGVGQLEERVGSPLEAPVERVSEAAQAVERLS